MQDRINCNIHLQCNDGIDAVGNKSNYRHSDHQHTNFYHSYIHN